MSTITNASSTKGSASDIFRVMIVDDSIVIRNAIARGLKKDPILEVVATAGNGEQAIQLLRSCAPDVIILDLEMPVMDGLTAIPQLKAIDPAVQIIVASTLTQKNAEISMRALGVGAADYLPKPSSVANDASSDFTAVLIEKVRALAAVARRKRGAKAKSGAMPAHSGAIMRVDAGEKKKITLRPAISMKPDIIAIGSSTGGPDALMKVVRVMGADLPQPIVITQHMHPAFTTILAENIASQCHVMCAEGKNDEILKPNRYYIAPGDFHMLVAKSPAGPVCKIVQDARENFCRPAVDPMLRSLVDVYGKRILVVMLTGMGRDGCKGSEAVVAAGGGVVAQDEASSIVWGMPGAVAMAGLCSLVLPLQELAQTVRQIAMRAGP